MRRYFYDIHVTSNAPIAGEALQRIGALFDVERTAMGRSPEERQLIRQRSARPVMDELAGFLDASLATISGRSELAKAIRNARSRWTALTRYLDGRLENALLDRSRETLWRAAEAHRGASRGALARHECLPNLAKPPPSEAAQVASQLMHAWVACK